MRVGLDGLLAAEGVAQIQAQLRGSQQESGGLMCSLEIRLTRWTSCRPAWFWRGRAASPPLHNLLASASETVGRLTLEVAALEG